MKSKLRLPLAQAKDNISDMVMPLCFERDNKKSEGIPIQFYLLFTVEYLDISQHF
jgi:hypothetical protein